MEVLVKTIYGTSFSNCHIIESGNSIALVDAPALSQELLNYLKGKEEMVEYILLTHDHFDHIIGLEDMLKILPNAKVVVHPLDASGLKDSTYSLTNLAGVLQPNVTPDVLVNNNDELAFGTTHIKVLHTSGHTDGSVCYIVEDNIFSGDTLFEGTCGRTDFVTGSYEEILRSLKTLATYPKHYKVFAGHGGATTIENELKFNPYLQL